MRPRGAALLGMLVVVLVAAGVFGGRVWWAERSAVPQSLAATDAVARGDSEPKAGRGGGTSRPSAAIGTAEASVGAGEKTSAPVAAGGPTAAANSGEVVAHIVGEVVRPGVVRLPAQARVEEAIRRTGGLSRRADATSVNMARPLVDGEQIVVLARGAQRAPGAAPAATGAPQAGAAGAAGQGAGGGAAGAAGSGTVNLNTADAATLETLPGVGPVMAQRILAWRTEHGRFSSVDELGEVSGVGEKTLARLRPLVAV